MYTYTAQSITALLPKQHVTSSKGIKELTTLHRLHVITATNSLSLLPWLPIHNSKSLTHFELHPNCLSRWPILEATNSVIFDLSQADAPATGFPLVYFNAPDDTKAPTPNLAATHGGWKWINLDPPFVNYKITCSDMMLKWFTHSICWAIEFCLNEVNKDNMVRSNLQELRLSDSQVYVW